MKNEKIIQGIYLASLELTALFAAASALLRRLGISLLDDLREWPPDIPARHQAMFQPPDEVTVASHTAFIVYGVPVLHYTKPIESIRKRDQGEQ
jgi:hypothetical protein